MDTDVSSAAPGRADRWDIDASGAGIVWDLADDARLCLLYTSDAADEL